jgi:hypothetical protein
MISDLCRRRQPLLPPWVTDVVGYGERPYMPAALPSLVQAPEPVSGPAWPRDVSEIHGQEPDEEKNEVVAPHLTCS